MPCDTHATVTGTFNDWCEHRMTKWSVGIHLNSHHFILLLVMEIIKPRFPFHMVVIIIESWSMVDRDLFLPKYVQMRKGFEK